MDSPKKCSKQIESFKTKLKFNGLFLLQDHIQIQKKNNFAGNMHFSHNLYESCGVLVFIMLTQKTNSFVFLTNRPVLPNFDNISKIKFFPLAENCEADF